jgi:pyruvate/2-oxoglutarate dehydrogenase complex dihydrolipoamide dehydrogenase (E3) component
VRRAAVCAAVRRTSSPSGDLNGQPQSTYIPLSGSRIALDQLIGKGKRSTADRVAIPRTVVMTPPLATVSPPRKRRAPSATG